MEKMLSRYDFCAEASELRIPPGREPTGINFNGYQFRNPTRHYLNPPGWSWKSDQRKFVGWILKSMCGKTLLIFND